MSWGHALTRRTKGFRRRKQPGAGVQEWCSLFAIGRWNRERERNGRIAAANFALDEPARCSLVEKVTSRRRQHMARERAQCSSRLAGRRRDRVPLALVAEMQERHEHKREGGEGRR